MFVFGSLVMSAPETPPVEDLEAFYPEVDDYFDERGEAQELRRSEIEWAHDNPPEIGGDK